MMNENKTVHPWVVAAGLLVLLMLFSGWCAPRVVIPPDPNTELVQATREALVMARDAQEEVTAVRRASRYGYFLALGLCVVIPALTAVLMLRAYLRTPVDEAEVMLQIEEMQAEILALPAPDSKALPQVPELETHDSGEPDPPGTKKGDAQPDG